MTPPDDLACIELVELVTDYLEGSVSREERARIERHLDDCGGCRAYVEQMRLTIAASGKVSAEEVPGETVERLLAVFRSARADADGAGRSRN